MIVTIQEAETNFSKLIERFQAGEQIIIAQNGIPIVQFAKVEESIQQRQVGFFGCDVDMESFDEPLDEMSSYI